MSGSPGIICLSFRCLSSAPRTMRASSSGSETAAPREAGAARSVFSVHSRIAAQTCPRQSSVAVRYSTMNACLKNAADPAAQNLTPSCLPSTERGYKKVGASCASLDVPPNARIRHVRDLRA
jgi:hypothetical protein